MPQTLTRAIDVAHEFTQVKTLRAVDYLRVSTEDQAKGYGVAAQGKKTKRYISAKMWQHVGTYVDDGVSGSLEAAERGELKRLMEDVVKEPRPFDVVVVKEGRAIGRTGRAFWRWVWELEDLKVFVAEAAGDFDNTTVEGRKKMRQAADFAETEWETIRERTQGGIQEKAEEGGHTGGAVRFGYRIQDKGVKHASRLVPDRCECTVVCELVHEWDVAHRAWHLLVEEFRSIRQTALQLNAEGLTTRDGRPWSAANLGARMRTLCGEPEIVFRGRRAKRGRDGELMYGEAVTIQLEPIFTPLERARLAQALDRRAGRGPSGPSTNLYPWTTRITSMCGGHYTGASKPGAARQYRCSGKQESYADAGRCACEPLDAEMVEHWLWRAVCQLLSDPERMATMSEDWTRKAGAHHHNHASRIADLERQIEVQRKAMSAVMAVAAKEAATRGADPERAINEAIKPLSEELKQLQSLHAEAVAWQKDSERAAQRATDLQELAKVARERMHSMGPAKQAAVVAILDVHATITKESGWEGTARDPLGAWFRERGQAVPELSDEAWAIVEPVLSAAVRRRRASNMDDRTVLAGMLHKARTGLSWDRLPEEYGAPTALRTRLRKWQMNGTWEAAMDALAHMPGTELAAEARPMPSMQVEGRIDPRLFVGIQGSSDGTPPNREVHSLAIRFRMDLAA